MGIASCLSTSTQESTTSGEQFSADDLGAHAPCPGRNDSLRKGLGRYRNILSKACDESRMGQ